MICTRVSLTVVLVMLLCPGARAQSMGHEWSQRFGGVSDDSPLDIAFDASGNFVVVGDFYGAVDFGGGTLTSGGSWDIFVAKYNSGGSHLWSQRFGDSDGQYAKSVAVDPSGNVLVTGQFSGVVDFGGGPLTSAGSYDIFVAKFDAGGNHVWSQGFGDGAYQTGRAVASDASGNVFVTGDFGSIVDFGGGPLTSAGSFDIFIAKFGPGGNHLWSKRYGDSATQRGTGVGVDASGNVVVTGYFGGTVSFGGGTLTSSGLYDIFVVKRDPAGSHLWSKRFGDSLNQYGRGVAVDASGNVFVTGDFEGGVDFGGGTLTSAGGVDIYAAKFDAGGSHLWSQRFGDSAGQYGESVAVDGSGNVFVTGYFGGVVDFGGGPLASAGDVDVCAAKFDAGGTHLWSERFGDGDAQQGRSVAVDASGSVFVTGDFGGAVDFGGGPLTSAGGSDIFIVEFSEEVVLCPPPSAAALSFRKDDPAPRPHNRTTQTDARESDLHVFEPARPEASDITIGMEYTLTAVDTTVLGSWSFETGGLPDSQGWTTKDLSGQLDTFFHVAGVTELSQPPLYPIDGSKSLWCGQAYSTADPYCDWVDLPGYGNSWVQYFESKPFSLNRAAISYTVSWDIEPDYDYARLELLNSSGDWVPLPVNAGTGYYDGTGVADECIEIDFEGETRLRFSFVSDEHWSDEDGLWDTNGAMLLDNLLLRNGNGDTLSFEDFEDEPAGATATLDGHWVAKPKQTFGNYAALHSGSAVLQEDPCVSVSSYLWGFFDDPTSTSYACGGWPAQGAVPYGPDPDGLYINNEIWSPWIPLTGSGNDVRLSFLVYRDLPLDNLVFCTWRVCSKNANGSGCASEWRSNNFLIYGEHKDWIEMESPITPLIPEMATATHIRIALGVVDMCGEWCGVYGTGACHSQAPLIDRVRVVRLDTNEPQWSVRDLNLWQDNFPELGGISSTSYARCDMANDIMSSDKANNFPGDSLTVIVCDPAGLAVDNTGGRTGNAVYVFVSPRDRSGAVRPYTWLQMQSPDNVAYKGDPMAGQLRWPFVSGVAPEGWDAYRLDYVYTSGGAQVPDAFCGDLMDTGGWLGPHFKHANENVAGTTGIFRPGDVVCYFFGAKNSLGTWNYYHRTRNGQGAGRLTNSIAEATASPMEWSVLPDAGRQPGDFGDVLYVDDADDRGGPAQVYFDFAFRYLGLSDRVDRFDVLGSSSMAGNSLASRVKNVQNQLIGDPTEVYQKILWNSSDLSRGLMGDGGTANGGSSPEKSDDFALAYAFLNHHPDNPGWAFWGDDAVEDWATLVGSSAVTLKNVFMNHTFVADDQKSLSGAVTPKIFAASPLPPLGFLQPTESCYAYGGCAVINDFDVPGASGLSQVSHRYAGATSGFQAAAVSQPTANNAATTARFFLAGFGYDFIRDDDTDGVPDYANHLREILVWFQNAIDNPTGIDPVAFSNSLEDNYPNPFNPTTTIRYGIAERGRVTLKIYNASGQLVRSLIDEEQTPRAEGFAAIWDGTDSRGQRVASGVYFYRLTANEYSSTKKMVLIK